MQSGPDSINHDRFETHSTTTEMRGARKLRRMQPIDAIVNILALGLCSRVGVFFSVDSNRKSHIRSFAPSAHTHIVNYKLITQSLQLLKLTRYVACVDRQTFWILQFKLR